MNRRVHELLEIDQNGDLMSRGVDSALMLLIIANVAAIVASTEGVVEANAARYLYYFEVASFGVFGVEYVLRVWSCTANPKYAHPVAGRLRYMFRPLMLADATAVLSFFIVMLLPSGLDLGALRVIRLLSRLASLARYSAGMQAVAAVASSRKSELLAVASVIGVLLVLASSLMYIAEHSAQPDKFTSIPSTMWWAVVTITTVGYGDVAPITPLGRLMAGAIALLAIGTFALPAGILGAGFLEQLNRKQSHAAASCPNCGEVIGNGRLPHLQANRHLYPYQRTRDPGQSARLRNGGANRLSRRRYHRANAAGRR